MITAAGSEPGPGSVSLGAAIRTGCADRGGHGQGQHGMGLGHGGPDTVSGLAISLAERPVRLSGKFLGAAVMNSFQLLMLPRGSAIRGWPWRAVTSPDGQPVPVQQWLVEYMTATAQAPGEPVRAARHADDPPRSRAGPSQSRPDQDHVAPRIGGRLMPSWL